MEIKKSTSPGSILTELIKHAATRIYKIHTYSFYRSPVNHNELPDDWNEEYITAIYKKYPRNNPSNYRGERVLAIMGRLIRKMIDTEKEQSGLITGNNNIE